MADINPDHLYPEFRSKIENLVLPDMHAYCEAHYPQFSPVIVEGFRTAEYQHELYEEGRDKPGDKVTNADGYENKSKHQSGLAVDIAPKRIEDGEIDWEAPGEWFEYLGHVARSHDLEWGGDWQSFKDIDHIQWPVHDCETYAAAEAWLKESALA